MNKTGPMASSIRSLTAAALAATICVAACAPAAPSAAGPEAHRAAAAADMQPTVILISLDGFRYDYIDRFPVPTLRRLAAEGVRAQSMIPAFPTLTFPNHYTLVTGLRPESHGIIANSMYDPEMDASFSLGDRDAVSDPRWWGGTPIWVSAERAGQRTASMFWPGSEAPIQGMHPTHWFTYDHDKPGPARIDQVLSWLDMPAAERPTFITLYFAVVDDMGHRHGPDSPEVAAAADSVDRWLGMLVQGLEARGILDRVNLIVTSDHGMAATSPDRVVVLDDLIDLERVHVVNWNPVLMVRARDGDDEAVFRALQGRHPNLQVHRRTEVPAHFHFRDHRRITPVVAIADEGWTITSRERFERDPERFRGGAHGYDHRLRSMGATFVARGPAFRQGLVVEPFESVHVHALMSTILGLPRERTDGDLRAVEHMLRPAATGARR
jgi:predicted AlkP superfamily pyrophosphatase or phosphodiesterase